MPFYKFEENDIFVNTLTTHPQVEFVIYSGSAYYNNEAVISGAYTNPIKHVPAGNISLYEYNIDRLTPLPGSPPKIGLVDNTGLIFPWVVKDGTRTAFRSVSTKTFDDMSHGAIIEAYYPMAATISKEYYSAARPRQTPSTQTMTSPTNPFVTGSVSHLYALKNVLDYYTNLTAEYAYSSSVRDLDAVPVGLVSIPSIFYGAEIEKGTISLEFYITGTLAGRLQDSKKNGELIETYGPNTGEVAGVALYNEGFLILTGSWALSAATDEYLPGFGDFPRWIYFAQSISGSVTAPNSLFTMNLSGTTKIQTITMFATAPKSELNHSNNPTFLSFPISGGNPTTTAAYIENPQRAIKNIVSSSYNDPTGSFEKTTYVSKIGIYDKDKNLVAIAKMATPVKKTPQRDFTFKLKLDI